MSATTSEFRTDVRVIGVVSGVHGMSHFFQLVIPPLFPFMQADFGVSYTALGLAMAVFYLVSGVAQTAAWFLVDHVGARPVLLGGLALFAGATAAVGLSPSFWVLFPVLALAALGNSVFHPADFAILNARVGKRRLGRAYGVHAIAGNIGWTLAPIASVGLATLLGWRLSLVVLGSIGLAVAAIAALREELIDRDRLDRRIAQEAAPSILASLRLLMVTPILMCFAYFVLLSIAMIGLQTFAIPTTMQLYGTTVVMATTALSAFLIGGAVGTLVGGVIADRTSQHYLVATMGILLAALAIAIVASAAVSTVTIVPLIAAAGIFLGVTLPSRDMLVRASTPAGASGKTYGFVYSGLDLGSALAPMAFGLFLDRGEPRWVYFLVIAALLLSTATVLNMRRPAPLPAAGE